MKVLVLLLLGVSSANAVAALFFRNWCDQDMDIIMTSNYEAPKILVTVPTKQRRLYGFYDGAMSFRPGWNGVTAVDFEIGLPSGNSSYSINLINGFDIPVAIEPLKGEAIWCGDKDCADGIRYPQEIGTKIREAKTNQRMTISFCIQPDAEKEE